MPAAQEKQLFIRDIRTGRLVKVIIADKGFYSSKNIELLREAKLEYSITLKRNSSLIGYRKLSNTEPLSRNGK